MHHMPEKFKGGRLEKIPKEKRETFEEFEGRFHERLVRLAPTFLDVRKKMGIKDNVGFGYLPETHRSESSLGALPAIKKDEKGKIRYSIAGFLGPGRVFIDLSEKDEKNILVMPVAPKSSESEQAIVSICDDWEEWDKNQSPFADNLINAPDDVFIGLIAHELAHSYGSESKFPPEIRSILENRHREIYPEIKREWRYDTTDEEEIDIIASLSGYKEQVIAKIDFMIDRFNKYGPYFKEKERVIKSLETRKQEVLKYCP